MPSHSFDDEYEHARQDPLMAQLMDEEERRLDAAVALSHARHAVNMTQDQLADKSHISRSTIIRIEKGQISPSFKTLDSLAQAMNKRVAIQMVDADRL